MGDSTTEGMAPRSLVRKLAEIMDAVERVPKRGRNEFHKYDYATEADIAATIRKELAARGVMLIPGVDSISREPVGEKGSVLTTAMMTFTFLDGESGETLTRPWAGAGTDKEDKGLYKALTGGEKYFLLKAFLIPTGDDPEATPKEERGSRRQDRGPVVQAPKSVVRGPLPDGCVYITGALVQEWGGEVTILDANGEIKTYKTADSQVAERAEQIAQANPAVPVVLELHTITRGKNAGKVKLSDYARYTPPLPEPPKDENASLDAEILAKESELPL